MLQRLKEIGAALQLGESSLSIGSKLRAAGLSGDETATLLTQAELRIRGRAKFGEAAEHMLFTRAGLEQASRDLVSQAHAARFAAAGMHNVADLGCGIGSESLALAAAGVGVVAVEIDSLTARFAEHNLRTLHPELSDSKRLRVLTEDAMTTSLTDVDAVFLDPARRTAGHRDTRRITQPDDYSPPLDFVFGLAERLPLGVKLGPGFDRDLIPQQAEAQWVSVNGQLVEMALWFGALARPGVGRAALVLRSGSEESEAHELTSDADSDDAEVRTLGAYIYEPDGAIIRARLIGLLANQLGAGMVSDHIAYLTHDHHIETPFAQAFRVVEQLPAREKALRRALAERSIGQLEIKKRGVDVDPAGLRTRLRLKGPNSATLILTRVAGVHTALLAERM
jgi:hypothetical protein